MPDDPVRPTSERLQATLATLDSSREELTKAWLLRQIERTPLDEVQRIETDRVARELPDLIGAIVGVIRRGEEEQELEPDSQLYRLAARLGSIRGPERPSSFRLARDVASLESAMLARLRRESPELDPELVLDAAERLASIFRLIQAVAVDELLTERSRELEWLANTDGLTGLYNFRYLQQQLAYLLDTQQRYGHPFAVLLLDVDGLKRINDSFGHAAGDRALLGVAGAIRASVRTVDVPARMGGDEFCVLAPHQTASRAEQMGERIGTAIEDVTAPNGQPIGASIGVVACPQHTADADRLLELADSAMYRAKAAGERVVVYSETGDGAANHAE